MSETPERTANGLLRHVRPSGRGTQSEHELAAKRAAVESIERRIDHNEKVRRQAARKRAAASCASVILGLAILTGIVLYLTRDSASTAAVWQQLHEVVEWARQKAGEAFGAAMPD